MSRKRVETWVMWSLAVVVPGGLVILAVWLSVRAARRQAVLAAASYGSPGLGRTSTAPRMSQPGALQG